MIKTLGIPKLMRRGAARPALRSDDPHARNIDSADDLLRFACKTIETLRVLLRSLPDDIGKKFITAYSQHYAYSVEHGERPTAPAIYYNEWKELQENGAMPMNDEHPGHERRHYHVYDAPSDVFVSESAKRGKRNARRALAKARKTLGLDVEGERTSIREAARRVLGFDE